MSEKDGLWNNWLQKERAMTRIYESVQRQKRGIRIGYFILGAACGAVAMLMFGVPT